MQEAVSTATGIAGALTAGVTGRLTIGSLDVGTGVGTVVGLTDGFAGDGVTDGGLTAGGATVVDAFRRGSEVSRGGKAVDGLTVGLFVG